MALGKSFMLDLKGITKMDIQQHEKTPYKPLKQMDEDELIWQKTTMLQQRRMLDVRIKKVNQAIGQHRFEKGKSNAKRTTQIN